MNTEEVIRKEALEFFKRKISNSANSNAVDDFHELKSRLYDFYTSENKAIFLDEIESNLIDNLKSHRDNAHGGKPSPTCQIEIQAEKLLFYIQQELDTLPAIAHQKFKPETIDLKRDKVFVSYSHLDKDFLTDVQRHFKPFLGHIDFWDDTKIKPGQKWKDEIRKAIKETKVAILLVSTDFLGSEFIATDELTPLLKLAETEGATILIVILKPCLFEDFEDLNIYQSMNPPSLPVSKMDLNETEELYVNLVRQTKKILKE